MIAGCMRSGKTLLGTILNANENVLITDEFHIFRSILPASFDFKVFAQKNWTPFGKIKPYNFDNALGKNYSLAEIRNRVIKHADKVFSLNLFGDSDAEYINDMIKFLIKGNGDNKCIVMIRDGRSIVHEQLIHYRKCLERNENPAYWTMKDLNSHRINFWPTHINSFLSACKLLCKKNLFNNVLIVRYEKLCVNPVKELNIIEEFLGIDLKGKKKAKKLIHTEQMFNFDREMLDRCLPSDFKMFLSLLGYY